MDNYNTIHSKSIVEIIERDTNHPQQIIKIRLRNMQKFDGLGPPDLCYLMKIKKPQGKINGKSKEEEIIGCYHYVQGLNLQSAANVSLYINNLINEQTNANNQKSTSWFGSKDQEKYEISKAYFCIFDAFQQMDIHVEISIPGGMKIYTFTSESTIQSINDEVWERAFVSSTLRTMSGVINVNAGKIFQEFEDQQSFLYFTNSLMEILKNKDDIPVTSQYQENFLFSYKGSISLQIFTNYMIRKKRLPLLLEILKTKVVEEPKAILFLCRLCEELGNIEQGLKFNAKYLLKYTYSPQLLYSQANFLLSFNKYEECYTLARTLLCILPQNYDILMLLAKIFYAIDNFVYCLAVLNTAIQYVRRYTPNFVQNEITKFEKDNKDITKINNIRQNTLINYNVTPKTPQIIGSKEQENNEQQVQNKNLHQTKSKITKMQNQQGSQHKSYQIQNINMAQKNLNLLSAIIEDEVAIILLLQQISQKTSLDQLQNHIKDLFFQESEVINMAYDELKDIPQIVELELNEIEKRKQLELQEQKKAMHLPNFDDDYSDEEEENQQLPKFLLDEQEQQKIKKQSNQGPKQLQSMRKKLQHLSQRNTKTTVWENNRVQHITEIPESNSSFDSSDHNSPRQVNSVQNLTKKQSYKVKILDNPEFSDQKQKMDKQKMAKELLSLNISQSHNLYKRQITIELQNIIQLYLKLTEISQAQIQIQSIPQALQEQFQNISEYEYLEKAMVFEILGYTQFSNQCHSFVTKKAYCLYSSYQNIKYLIQQNNLKGSLIAFAECMDDLEHLGMEQWEFLPPWLDDLLCEMVCKFTQNTVIKLMKELKFSDQIINNSFERQVQFRCQGI